MITTIKHNGITWINLESPSVKEVNEIAEHYPVHPLVTEELSSLTMRAKVDVYDHSLYLILHFPLSNPIIKSNIAGDCELDLVIGRDFLITTNYCSFPVFEKLLKNVKRKENLRQAIFKNHAGFLAFNILKELYDSCIGQLDQLYLKINRIEKEIFNGGEKETVRDISMLRRDVLDFRRTIYPHESVLVSFEQSGKNFFNSDFRHYANDLLGEYSKIRNSIESNKEIIETLHQTNESLLSTKTNEVMKTLTIMAFITFPLMLLSGVFGMNTVATPIIGRKGDFWIITIFMVVGTFLMFLFFKKKKWL